MRKTLVIALGLALGAVAAGCEQKPQTQPRSGVGAPPPVVTKSLPADAQDPKDASIPPSTAAQAPQPPDGTPDTALTQKEIRKDMPLPGQANDHSNDAFAKRGDDTKSKTTSN